MAERESFPSRGTCRVAFKGWPYQWQRQWVEQIIEELAYYAGLNGEVWPPKHVKTSRELGAMYRQGKRHRKAALGVSKERSGG